MYMEMKEYQYHDVHFRGTIERVIYMTTNPEGEPREKYANIYLPYGYDHNDSGKKYNILYMMHGGGGNPDAWLDCSKIKNMLDCCIDAKEVEPLIVVFPSFYKEQVCRVGKPVPEVEGRKTLEFLPELTAELLPAVEGKYHGYAADTTPEELRAVRNHRGFGGFSMGSCTTWHVLCQKLDYFAWFVPMSGDCWAVQPQGGKFCTRETATYIHDAVAKWGLPPDAYHIFAATGSEDPAHLALTPQIEAMKQDTDIFTYSEDAATGNLHYGVKPGAVHAYEAVYHYLYTYLPYLFQGEATK